MITQAEIERRKECDREARASFAVDNLSLNPETEYIHELYNNGEITTEEAIKKINDFYREN